MALNSILASCHIIHNLRSHSDVFTAMILLLRRTKAAQQSKQLMRMLLNHHLAGKALHTRELIKDLQKF